MKYIRGYGHVQSSGAYADAKYAAQLFNLAFTKRTIDIRHALATPISALRRALFLRHWPVVFELMPRSPCEQDTARPEVCPLSFSRLPCYCKFVSETLH